MGAFRKTIRGWRREISSGWQRINTFYRIVLSIMIAMILIYAARTYLLDPLQTEVLDKLESLESAGVPEAIPTREDDEEIQRELLRSENLERTLADWKRQSNEAIASREQLSRSALGEALSELDLALLNTGLRIQNATTVTFKQGEEPKNETTLQQRELRYQLLGSFPAIRQALDVLTRFPYPAEVRNIRIALVENPPAELLQSTGGAPLTLNFELIVYHHANDAAR
jgi:hypothetical protein